MTTDRSSQDSSGRQKRQPHNLPPFWVRTLASAFGAGYFPFASGTAGSAAALAVYWILPGLNIWWILLAGATLSYLIGIPLASSMERSYGKDPSAVVIDEVAGMWLSLVAIPYAPGTAIAAFFLFRAFDIWKPWPANVFDRMDGGFGIMTDDIFAGAYANIVLQLILLVEPIHHFLTQPL